MSTRQRGLQSVWVSSPSLQWSVPPRSCCLWHRIPDCLDMSIRNEVLWLKICALSAGEEFCIYGTGFFDLYIQVSTDRDAAIRVRFMFHLHRDPHLCHRRHANSMILAVRLSPVCCVTNLVDAHLACSASSQSDSCNARCLDCVSAILEDTRNQLRRTVEARVEALNLQSSNENIMPARLNSLWSQLCVSHAF